MFSGDFLDTLNRTKKLELQKAAEKFDVDTPPGSKPVRQMTMQEKTLAQKHKRLREIYNDPKLYMKRL